MDVIIGKDEFSKRLAETVQVKFIKYETHVFPDSEIKPKLETEEGIKGKRVLIVSRTDRLEPSINSVILEIFFLASLLKELGADEINLFIPYMFYSRQDKQFLSGEPKSLSNIAELYQSLGIKTIFTVNSHLFGKEGGSLQDFFTYAKIHDISASEIFSKYLKGKKLQDAVVIGPDKGAMKMVTELSNLIDGSFECLEKERNHVTGEIKIKPPSKKLQDRDVIIYDDVASSGGTIVKAFEFVKAFDPKRIFIVLPHIVTMAGIDRLSKLDCLEVITTDSLISEEKYFTELSLIPLVCKHINSEKRRKQSFLQ